MANPVNFGKQYLIRGGWSYTGPLPHEWSHPEISPTLRSYADALLLQITHDGTPKEWLASQVVVGVFDDADRELEQVGLDPLSPERMTINRLRKHLDTAVSLSSGKRRPSGPFGTRNREANTVPVPRNWVRRFTETRLNDVDRIRELQVEMEQLAGTTSAQPKAEQSDE